MIRYRGFTLIELMVVIALVAIIAVIAIPSFTTLIRDNRAESQAEQLNALLQYARSEAVIRKITSTVAIDTSTGKIEVSAAGDSLRSTNLALDSVTFDTSANSISYRPNGTATVPNFTAVFCAASDPSSGRLLTVSGSGATALHAKGKKADGTTLGSCSA